MGKRWRLERISDCEETQIRHAKIASEGTWRAAWPQGQESMVVFENQAVGGKKDSNQDTWVEEVAELRSGRSCKNVGKVVRIVIKYGCHGEQYLRRGLKVLVPEVSVLISVDWRV